MERKIYRIVDIPNKYSIVVNYGADDGAEEGQELEIFAQGKEIIDPESNKSLGTLDYIKDKVEVISVYSKMCLCKTIETKTPVKGLNVGLNQLFETYRPAFDVEEREISGKLSNKDNAIHVGDLVRISLS